uniref:Uncharacterized protein n=1 Tax=Ciona savignyi TaxID=51511 RepID=H2Y5H5_CIOSA
MTNTVKAPEESNLAEVENTVEEAINHDLPDEISATAPHSGVQRVKCNGDAARQESDDSAIHSDDDTAQNVPSHAENTATEKNESAKKDADDKKEKE